LFGRFCWARERKLLRIIEQTKSFVSSILLIFYPNLVDSNQAWEETSTPLFVTLEIMPIYKLGRKIPRIAKTAFVHPQAVIIGDVEIGDHCFIGAGAVLRGDFGKIKIGCRTSIQENCVIHVGLGVEKAVSIHDNVIISHGTIVHDATIKSYVLVGMGSILMNGVFCEDHVLIAAGSIVKEDFHIPSHVVIAGNPARIIKPLSDEQRKRIHQGVKAYQDLVKRYKKTPFGVVEFPEI
jgi:carbonic anhydrase/acetyltransferase-like protein (isoleucine patch superfamily)